MEQKKKIILIIILLALLVITSTIAFIYRKKKEDQKIPTDQTATVSDRYEKEKERIQGLFNDYLSQTGDKSSIDLFTVTDSQNRTVPIDSFAKAIDLKIAPSIEPLLDKEAYFLVTCFSGDGNSYGIILNVNSSVSGSSQFQDIVSKAMREWEPTMLADTKMLLFPGVTDLSFVSLNANIRFNDGDFRYANIALPDGSKKSINYTLKSDSIIITNAKECLYGLL